MSDYQISTSSILDSTSYLKNSAQSFSKERANFNQLQSKLNSVSGLVDNGKDSGSDINGRKPHSLFYNGAKNDGNYGLFYTYNLGNSKNYIQSIKKYLGSERKPHLEGVSPSDSKNPSADKLVEGKGVIGNKTVEFSAGKKHVVKSAPYEYTDFLYTKHYGLIPNNYMLTLRRFKTPVLDNLSFPRQVLNSPESVINGAGQPVAQAVTWIGGDTENKLSSILAFSTGLNWKQKTQADMREIKNPGNMLSGFLGTDIRGAVSDATLGNDSIENLLQRFSGFEQNATALFGLLEGDTYLRQKFLYKLRDRAMQDSNSPLNDWAWSGFDTIYDTYIRDRGLKFEMTGLTLNFYYDLTSTSYVNTKLAMLDIMGNLMAIGSNMGNFAAPYLMYDPNFPPAALAFPGGQKALINYYSNPNKFILEYGKQLVNEGGKGIKEIMSYFKQIDEGNKNGADIAFDASGKLIKGQQLKRLDQEDNAELNNWQAPISVLTGAPIGEWHLTVGNPMNPIAMIGNLICDKLTIKLGDKLGPDDFPTTLTATFDLKHARSREPGEIQSMFNRGQGRFYSTPVTTSASTLNSDYVANADGKIVPLGTNPNETLVNTISNQSKIETTESQPNLPKK